MSEIPRKCPSQERKWVSEQRASYTLAKIWRTLPWMMDKENKLFVNSPQSVPYDCHTIVPAPSSGSLKGNLLVFSRHEFLVFCPPPLKPILIIGTTEQYFWPGDSHKFRKYITIEHDSRSRHSDVESISENLFLIDRFLFESFLSTLNWIQHDNSVTVHYHVNTTSAFWKFIVSKLRTELKTINQFSETCTERDEKFSVLKLKKVDEKS